MANQPQMIYLKDYVPPAYLVDSVFIYFDLHEDVTEVRSVMAMRRNPEANHNATPPLVLNGEDIVLKSILINNAAVPADYYQITDETLTITDVPETFTLETIVAIKPHENTKLSGLYKSNGNYCTQCESHGFRRITYFPDRPDVLTRFTVSISADKAFYPMLLSNGNLVDEKLLEDGRHWVKWEDPSLKPCYLFALVAGDFDVLEDSFVKRTGATVKLGVYVEQGKRDQAEHAMHALKRSMKWDEDVYGRVYDLDRYMIVAVSDFNYGAMENKGLNIFNDRYVLAKPETATDDDYVMIEEVIGHEYFHNWSGNRVTLRDWFQITLKEGLTVFRDQSFTEDVILKSVKRIQDARVIRNHQFPQDAGPMAHPIRPDHYIEINNFYTVTVYNKGAEIIRMVKTLLGADAFHTAMDVYFSRFDGRAVTCEDFIDVMEESSGVDLSQFRLWYSQAGTPRLSIKDDYDEAAKRYTLSVEQTTPATPDQNEKKPFHIPLKVGLLSPAGETLSFELETGERSDAEGSAVLSVKAPAQQFVFNHVETRPVPSLLRHFSAPVKVNYEYTDEQLRQLMMHDSDDFARWDASQQWIMNTIMSLLEDKQADCPLSLPETFIEAFKHVLSSHTIDDILIAEMLILPSEGYVLECMPGTDITVICEVREFVIKALAEALTDEFHRKYEAYNKYRERELNPKSIGIRRLGNIALVYLTRLQSETYQRLAHEQFKNNHDMTNVMGALTALNDIDCEARESALNAFYEQWQNEHLVVDKWFGLQARSTLPGRLDVVKALLTHYAYQPKNPNRVRALVGTFCSGNMRHFHDISGAGYEFLAEEVKKADAFNPQLAARLIEPFVHWRKHNTPRQKLMRAQLEALAKLPKLSKDVYEVVTRSLR